MPQLDQRYFFSQFTICIIILFITYIIVNNEYFRKYLIILNNRNKFINFHIRTITNISEKIKLKSLKISKERLEALKMIKSRIEEFKKRKKLIKVRQYDNINKNINILELIHQKSNLEIRNMLDKIYKKHYTRIKKYIILFLIR